MTKAKNQVQHADAPVTDEGVHGSEAFPEPSKDEILEARAQGVKDAIAESTKEAYMRGANEGYGDAPAGRQIVVDKEVFKLQDLLDLGADGLRDRIAEDADNPITEGKVAGLLEVERSGKNRTDVVKVLMERLGIESPYEVTAAGPGYTNDITPTTKL